MELKRYVLTELHGIIDTTKVYDDETNDYKIDHEELLVRHHSTTTVFTSFGKVKKTSDNLLDLVEVGDLVEEVLICQVTSIERDANGNITRFYYLLGSIAWFDVKAIYKRQQNGDFKRYEVKE